MNEIKEGQPLLEKNRYTDKSIDKEQSYYRRYFLTLLSVSLISALFLILVSDGASSKSIPYQPQYKHNVQVLTEPLQIESKRTVFKLVVNVKSNQIDFVYLKPAYKTTKVNNSTKLKIRKFKREREQGKVHAKFNRFQFKKVEDIIYEIYSDDKVVLYNYFKSKFGSYSLSFMYTNSGLLNSLKLISESKSDYEQVFYPRNYEYDFELIDIVKNGDSDNRIDVVIMGDGYTLKERRKFIEDVKRLSDDMFSGTTFKSYLPLINVKAVFIPSNESGIGNMGKPKDTAFGLYRDGIELRGIYASKPELARTICYQLGLACDFPTLIGNDDYYGGLGGELTISTRSPTSGTIVLRHEMGHNFDEVGEEYDGGEVYEGVNSDTSLDRLKWQHWVKDWNPLKPVVRQQNKVAVQNYAWHDLSNLGPYKIKFTSDGSYNSYRLQISSSGVDRYNGIQVRLDGKKLMFPAKSTVDRTFTLWESFNKGLTKGNHYLTFEVDKDIKVGKVPNQLCNVELIEYGKNYNFNKNYIGVFPTYDYQGKKTYRPTDETCLMRNMTSTTFCNVCKEGLWLHFLNIVDIIDDLQIQLVRRMPTSLGSVGVLDDDANHELLTSRIRRSEAYFLQLKLIKFETKNVKYEIQWIYNDKPVKKLRNFQRILIPKKSKFAVGVWKVNVKLITDMIRKDTEQVTTSQKTFLLKGPKKF